MSAKNYAAVNEVCAGMELISVERPVLMSDLRPRVGVENRLPEYIEEAIQHGPDSRGFAQRSCAVPARQALNIWRIASSAACAAMNAIA